MTQPPSKPRRPHRALPTATTLVLRLGRNLHVQASGWGVLALPFVLAILLAGAYALTTLA